jgi:tRNA(Ile2) C34 agmatinyltransferase TiaS
MKVYIGFDDTDNVDADRGTGKLARWFEEELPEGCSLDGVLRQQLLVHQDVPYTSHNSSACLIVSVPDESFVTELTGRAVEHVEKHALQGSDPGVCVAHTANGGLHRLMAFGRECTARIITQKEAMSAAAGFHLSGHGGTNDGIIGAAAAVGLSASGWSGRFIEYGRLRNFPDVVPVSELEHSNILVASVDRDAKIPAPGDLVRTKDWLRPRLWGGRAVLLVMPKNEGLWEIVGGKRRHQQS